MAKKELQQVMVANSTNQIDAYDNQILVASGIGITPALSVIRAHKDSRRINLFWAVRDHHLLEFFLRHLYLDHQGWNLIFYTGKKKLQRSSIHVLASTNVCIIEGRPKLNEVIPNIIYGIESGLGLPERYSEEHRVEIFSILVDRFLASENGSVRDVAEDISGPASGLSPEMPSQELDTLAPCRGLTPDPVLRRSVSTSNLDNIEMGFHPWRCHEDAKEYVKSLDRKLILSAWGIFYCGGAKPVLKDLRKISDEFGIRLHVESFAW